MNNEGYNYIGKRYIALARASDASDGTTSTEAQLAMLHEKAAEFQMIKVDEVILDGITGSMPGKRQDMEQLIKRKRTMDDFDVLLVQRLDRLTRGGADHGSWFEFECKRAGIHLYIVGDNIPQGPYASLIKVVKYEAARDQAFSISQRSTQGYQLALEQGRVTTSSHTPYGCWRLYLSADGKPLHIIRDLRDGRQQKLDPTSHAVIDTYGQIGAGSKGHYHKQKHEKVLLTPGDANEQKAMNKSSKHSQRKRCISLVAVNLLMLRFSSRSPASVAYAYVSDQTAYTSYSGATVSALVFIKESLTAVSSSLITADSGLLGAGWSISRTGTLPSNPSALLGLVGSTTSNGANFPGGWFATKPGGSASFLAGDNAVNPNATSGPVPNASGLIEIGVINITAGSTPGTTSFTLANYAYPASSDGYTDTFNNFYNLDATSTGTPAYTGASASPETFTVTVVALPSNISSGSYAPGLVNVGGSQNSVSINGILNVSGTGQLTVTGPLTVYNTSGYAATLTGGSITAGSISTLSPGTFTWSGGKLGIASAATTMTLQSPGTISVNALNSFTPTTGRPTRSVLTTNSLTLGGSTNAWTGKLDLASNDMIVSGAGTAGLTTLTNQLKQGYNGGRWNGSGGIVSSTAAADTNHLTALGSMLNTGVSGSPIYSTFDGVSSGANDVLLKYTYYGDANLDGKVDGSDYSKIDSGYLTHQTGWSNGDFNYDGVIDGSDYTLIDNAFNTQGASFAATIASPNAEVTAQLANATTAVPEPGLIGVAIGLGLLSIRRQKACRRRVDVKANIISRRLVDDYNQ